MTNEAKQRGALPDWQRMGFAFHATDEIYLAQGASQRDPVWDAGEFRPFGPVSLSPAAALFSYGLGIFEGLKAQRTADGRTLLFRPEENARRFRASAERLLLEPFPADRFVEIVTECVQRNERFVPPHGMGSLYVRPLEHGVEPLLGVRAAAEFQVLVIASPVGPYFSRPEGLRLKVLEQGRVAPGGCGAAKAVGNYAGGMAVVRPWREQGFDDVLYLDARHVRFLTETSGSNVFVRLGSGALVTPPLDDQILAGVTRASVIQIATELGVAVEQRELALEQVLAEGEEIFCTGTAWTLQSVTELEFRGRIHSFPETRLRRDVLDRLSGIQQGRLEDPYGWTTEVPR